MAGEDPATAALWALHRDRLARQVEQFVPAAPAPGMAWRDPRALRFAVLLAAIAAALVAGPERYGRVAAAFDWRDGASAAATARLDAWIDPPAYANKPPILLDLAANRDPSQKIVTPEGSALVVRADADVFETRVEGAIAPVAGGKPADKSAPPRRRRPARRPRSAGRLPATARSSSAATAPRSADTKSRRPRSARRPSRCSSRRAPISAAR